MIIKGKNVDYETKENNEIFIDSLPTGLMSEELSFGLKSLDSKKAIELSDILFNTDK